MTKKIRKGLGKIQAGLLSALSEKNKTVFTIKDAVSALHKKDSTTAKLLHDLTKNGWLFRLTKGKYLILPLEAGIEPMFTEHEFVLATALISPCYISYWSALNYYGLTEQVSKTVFLATTKRKLRLKLMGTTFIFVTINKKKFFGYKTATINNHIIFIAELEKAIIDCLDLPRNCDGITEIVKALFNAKEELDFKKLILYAKRMHNAAIVNRLGYILDILAIPTDIKPSKHYVLLDPVGKKKGRYNKKWKIIENMSLTELLSWREH